MDNYDALFAIGCLVGIAVIYYGPWQGLCVEFSRQIIFEEREKLFDLAASGQLSFSADDYLHLRDFLNKSIRFSHEMTIWKFAANRSALRRYGKVNHAPSLHTVVRSIKDEKTRTAVVSIVNRSSGALIMAMAARSLPALLATAILFVIKKAGIRNGFSGKIRQFEREVQREVDFAPSV